MVCIGEKMQQTTAKELQADPEPSGAVISAHIVACRLNQVGGVLLGLEDTPYLVQSPQLKDRHKMAKLMFAKFFHR